MEEAFRSLLTGYAPLTALVAQRIFWTTIPQDTIDAAVVLYLISGAPTYHMQGATDLVGSRVQIDVRALTQTSAWAVARAIKAKLSGFKGSQGDIEFGGIFLDSERQSSEKPGTTLYFRVSMDFECWSSAA